MSYMVIIREPIKGSDDYMEAEYNGVEYADREDAEAVLMCAKDQGLEAWIERCSDET